MWVCVLFALAAAEEFDFVVVGSGAGGAPFSRSLADKGFKVLLLEQGPLPDLPNVTHLGNFASAWTDPAIALPYESSPQPGLDNRTVPMYRAAVGGGCTSHNAGILFLGDRHVFDLWGHGWGWAAAEPYVRKVLAAYEGSIVGTDGVEWNDRLFQIAADGGYPPNAHPNDLRGKPYGASVKRLAGVVERAKGFVRRASAWTQFLQDPPPTLTIQTRTKVVEILFNGTTAEGVVARDASGREFVVRPRLDVVLSAGVLDSVRLLQRGGVGPAALLSRLGVPIRADRPGVGSNFQDHLFIPAVSPPLHKNDPLPLPAEAFGEAGLILYPPPQSPAPLPTHYIAVYPAPPNPKQNFNPSKLTAIEADAEVFYLKSRGTVEITSAEEGAPLRVDPSYFSHPDDMPVAVAALRDARAVLRAPSLRSIFSRGAGELLPGENVTDDADLRAFIRRVATSDFHLAGTCRMGASSDPLAVVDSLFYVIGTSRLRVVDASVMPLLPAGNMQIHTMALALRAADVVAQEWGVGAAAPKNPTPPLHFTARVHADVGTAARPSLYAAVAGPPGGVFYFDATARRARIDGVAALPWGNLSLSIIERGGEGFLLLNGQCRREGEVAFDASVWFEWLSVAAWGGVEFVGGRRTNLWTQSLDSNSTFRKANVDEGGNVVFLFLTHPHDFGGGVVRNVETVVHFDAYESFDPPPSAVFDVAAICLTDGRVCDAARVRRNLTIYTFEPEDAKFRGDLTDEDAADAAGDAAFGCADLKFGGNATGWDSNAVVVRYEVEVAEAWGQYAMCNYKECLGNNERNVGRERSFSLGEDAGQCDGESDVGFWYSFRAGGKCAEGQVVGDGCFWRVLERVKTIATECLLRLGFKEACGESVANATRLFQFAFDKNASEGGCDNVPSV